MKTLHHSIGRFNAKHPVPHRQPQKIYHQMHTSISAATILAFITGFILLTPHGTREYNASTDREIPESSAEFRNTQQAHQTPINPHGSGTTLPPPPGFRKVRIALLQTPTPATNASHAARQWTQNDRNCLIRAMYFESRRKSEDGLLAVGTVVMNRVEHPKFPDTICGVVGQWRQFAPGVLTRPIDPHQAQTTYSVAEKVLAGKRHTAAQKALFFHTEGTPLPWNNMQFATIAGGNVFYNHDTN